VAYIAIPALGRPGQEDHEYEDSLVRTARPSLKKFYSNSSLLITLPSNSPTIILQERISYLDGSTSGLKLHTSKVFHYHKILTS
jgi:hypothetical protein